MSDLPRPDSPAESGNLRWWLRLIELEERVEFLEAENRRLELNSVHNYEQIRLLNSEKQHLELLSTSALARMSEMEQRLLTLTNILEPQISDHTRRVLNQVFPAPVPFPNLTPFKPEPEHPPQRTIYQRLAVEGPKTGSDSAIYCAVHMSWRPCEHTIWDPDAH